MHIQTAEHRRLDEHRRLTANWKLWGPYVSERSWGTVREDYSPDGTAWDFLPHDHARSRAYRWGEDGLAGFCDRYQLLVFSLALWNGQDPILKERLFGLTSQESNHGEDVKEYYYYLDSTPTHSYMKYLYKYPQRAFPYQQLLEGSRRRTASDGEYELIDTGIFDDDRYWDVFVEYAKAGPNDVCIRIEAFNRGPEPASLHVLPQLCFRNTWGWGATPGPRPVIHAEPGEEGAVCLLADEADSLPLSNLIEEYRLGPQRLYAEPGRLLFTHNESNWKRLLGEWAENETPYVKDAFHRHIIAGEECVNPAQEGTKAAIHYADRRVAPGESVVVRLRLTDQKLKSPLGEVDRIVHQRREEADAFYAAIHPPHASDEERRIQRQALAGMLWSKQVYLFDVRAWLEGDNPDRPPPQGRKQGRNRHWRHLNSMRILSMPDKWEFPWFAAWDLAFQAVPLALVDLDFAKEQLWLLLFEQFQHPNGQIPAYEWEFSDLNPPVQAWAVWRLYRMEGRATGKHDRLFLERCFHKLLLNFTWWVNKVDGEGNNVFEGGFLGLDNITVLDRSHELPHGATLKQSDGTGWMGMFCLNLMRIALELAKENPAYLVLATKFFEHYVYIGSAMKHMGGRDWELWSHTEGFFYDVIRHSDGTFHKFRVRSLVGLIPLYATERIQDEWIEPFPDFQANFRWFLRNRGELVERCVDVVERDGKTCYVLALTNEEQLKRILRRVWDPDEFRSPFGLRSLSKYHEQNPFSYAGMEIRYEPGHSSEQFKGGNSNWRGPVWFPTTFMMIESLRKLGQAYGDSFKVRSPCPEEAEVTLTEMAAQFADSLISLFKPDAHGRRPAFGSHPKFAQDPHWRDYLLFYEHFHSETGQGLGASHQTGWTGLVAVLIDEWRR
jgi:hypothetical protein